MIQYLKGVEPLLQKESGLASFGSEFYELSCWILLVEPSAQISYMILNILRTFLRTYLRKFCVYAPVGQCYKTFFDYIVIGITSVKTIGKYAASGVKYA